MSQAITFGMNVEIGVRPFQTGPQHLLTCIIPRAVVGEPLGLPCWAAASKGEHER